MCIFLQTLIGNYDLLPVASICPEIIALNVLRWYRRTQIPRQDGLASLACGYELRHHIMANKIRIHATSSHSCQKYLRR